jgi:hypothetical protein
MPENNTSLEAETISKRPRMITLLSILVLLVGLYHLLKLSQTILQWDILSSLPLMISPVYLAIQGLVWGITGPVIFWSLWTGKNWGRWFCLTAVLIYTAAFWIDLIWISEPTVLKNRWGVNLILSILGLGGSYIFLTAKSSRDYFTRNPATID